MFLVSADEERISVPGRIDSLVLLKTKAMNVPNDLSMFLLKTIHMHVPCSCSCTEIMFLLKIMMFHVPAAEERIPVPAVCSVHVRAAGAGGGEEAGRGGCPPLPGQEANLWLNTRSKEQEA